MRDYREIWVAKWLHRVEHTHTRTYTHIHKRADGEASEWTRLFRETGNCRLFPPPSLLLLFLSLSPRPFSPSPFLPPSLRLVLSRTRTDGGLSRNDLCVPMCRNNRPLREKTRVVGTIVSRQWWVVVVVVVEVASHNHQSQSFGEKAAGYLTSCYTPPPRVYDPLTAIMQPNLSLPLYNRVSRDVRLFRWEDLSLSLWMMQRNGLREISPVWNSYLFLSRQKEENLLYSMESISNSNKEIT